MNKNNFELESKNQLPNLKNTKFSKNFNYIYSKKI